LLGECKFMQDTIDLSSLAVLDFALFQLQGEFPFLIFEWQSSTYETVFPLNFGVSACAQKIGGFSMLNNVKVKNESAWAQQKC